MTATSGTPHEADDVTEADVRVLTEWAAEAGLDVCFPGTTEYARRAALRRLASSFVVRRITAERERDAACDALARVLAVLVGASAAIRTGRIGDGLGMIDAALGTARPATEVDRA